MHDALGRALRVGDAVVIVGVVKSLSPTEDYCNVAVETSLGRKPDGMKETFSAINTAVLIKAGVD